MTPISKYKFAIIIVVISFVILILLLVTNAIRNRLNNTDPQQVETDITLSPNPTITRVPLNRLKTANDVPTLSPNRGEGIDIDSPQVKTSMSSIEKLSSALPFNRTFTTSQGITVEILIPPLSLLENSWTLTVHIFGPEYQIPTSDPAYTENKNAFLDGAAEVIRFIESNDVTTDDIIVQWGDRAFIQERSAQWLSE